MPQPLGFGQGAFESAERMDQARIVGTDATQQVQVAMMTQLTTGAQAVTVLTAVSMLRTMGSQMATSISMFSELSAQHHRWLRLL